MAKLGIIYKATNKINGKSYIGKTVRKLEIRINRHYNDSKVYHYKFATALRKYSKNNWKWEILHKDIPASKLSSLEKIEIKKYDTLYNGYNSTEGGEDNIGKSNPFYGHKHSRKTKNNWSKIRKGVKQSEDTILKRANSNSKIYKIIRPNGEIEIIKNLAKYCRENALDNRNMGNVAKGKRKQYKGYKCSLMGKVK